MFETETSSIDDRRADAPEATVFPPAPVFLLALGVGLFIGLAVLANSTRQS